MSRYLSQHMFKRRKLPPVVIVSAVDSTTVSVIPKRVPTTYHDEFVRSFSPDKKRHRRYKISSTRMGEIQAWCVRRDIKYDGIPMAVNILRPGREADTFVEEKCGRVWDILYDYQKEGVRKICTAFRGRALLADDMGLGKTMQGIAYLDYYNDIGTRILILTPSYLRFHWAYECEKWLGITPAILRAKKKLDVLHTSRVNIVSYDMLAGVQLTPYDIILADESHYIKNHKAKRTKAALPLLKRAEHVLLLSGTPALNRPVELFTQLHCLQPRWFRTYTAFCYRYCNAKLTNFGLDVRGSSCQEELHYIMRQGMMVRRLKDMLDLPPKTREAWRLELPSTLLKDLRAGWNEWSRLNEVIHHSGSEEAKSEAFFQRKSLLSDLFRKTCAAKKNAVAKFVRDLLEREDKFLFFGYHKDMLDCVQEQLGVKHIRIDGSTPAERRPALVRQFQEDEDTRVAVLSIGAAGTGLTLTAASTVVFGELYWVPGSILQAEDRAHRIGQKDPVVIHYLVAKETLDERIYPMLSDKIRAIDTVLDNSTKRSLEGEKEHVVYEELSDVLDALIPE